VKSEERDFDLLSYIQESIARIEEYTLGGREPFLEETIVQDVTLRRLETLADAASHLSDALRARHPEIPWREIYGFRNVAAHAYRTIDIERVWVTVQRYLPSLKAVVDEELRRFPPPQAGPGDPLP
jgi:uncharacterized protein with HEPN domain